MKATDEIRIDMDGETMIDPKMTESQAREWASRRYDCAARTRRVDHPTSIGDSVYEIRVQAPDGRQCRGIGYSGLAPVGISGWAKAAADILRTEAEEARR